MHIISFIWYCKAAVFSKLHDIVLKLSLGDRFGIQKSKYFPTQMMSDLD